MATYKLYYFNGRGRAETIRIIFALTGVSYEDVRMPNEKWLEFKPQTPFGSVPVLEEDGKMLAGSTIIARYLGEKYGLAGGNSWENAEISNCVDFMDDFAKSMITMRFEKDEAKKAVLEETFRKDLPKYLTRLDKLVGEEGYICLALTWADLYLYCQLDTIVGHGILLDPYPGLGRLRKNIEAIPAIATWLNERPQTPF